MTTHSSGGRVTRPFLFWALCVGLSVLGDALGQSALSVLAFEEGGGAALASVLTWPLLADLALPIVLGWVSDLLPAAVTAAAGNAALSLTWLAVSAVHPSALVGALQMLESGLNRLTVGPAIRLANALAGGPVTGRAASLSASLAWTGLAVGHGLGALVAVRFGRAAFVLDALTFVPCAVVAWTRRSAGGCLPARTAPPSSWSAAALHLRRRWRSLAVFTSAQLIWGALPLVNLPLWTRAASSASFGLYLSVGMLSGALASAAVARWSVWRPSWLWTAAALMPLALVSLGVSDASVGTLLTFSAVFGVLSAVVGTACTATLVASADACAGRVQGLLSVLAAGLRLAVLEGTGALGIVGRADLVAVVAGLGGTLVLLGGLLLPEADDVSGT